MRIALGVEYNGRAFHGWQRQAECATVQAAFESALSLVANHRVVLHNAGRTDTGVHGLNMVAHFDTESERPMKAWVLGVNSYISQHHDGQCSVRWAKPVSNDFHARFSALSRRYRYQIYNRRTRSAIHRGWSTHCFQPLNAERMNAAAQALLGVHDFDSYRTVHCQAHSPVREILDIVVKREDDRVIMEVEANGFLHHMVRNIAGVLMTIGSGEKPVEWAAEVLAVCDRTKGGMTAPPDGLYFLDVRYPTEFQIPDSQMALEADIEFGKTSPLL
jgi:tRNA pseudouridine38-40 synthase